MSGWEVTTDQWRRWIEETPVLVSGPPEVCDAFDDDLRKRLQRAPFLGADATFVGPGGEDTGVSSTPSSDSFDSMATMIRPAPERPSSAGEIAAPDPVPAGLTLEVGITTGLLEVELEPVHAAAPSAVAPNFAAQVEADPGAQTRVETPPSAAPEAEAPAASTVFEPAPAPGPQPSVDASASVLITDDSNEVEERASTEDVEGLYIPTLTRAVTERVKTVPTASQPDTAVASVTSTPVAEDVSELSEVPDASPVTEPGTPQYKDPSSRPTPLEPVVTGETVVAEAPRATDSPTTSSGTVIAEQPQPPTNEAPPSAPVAREAQPEAASSQTAGEIVTGADPAAESMTRGEIEGGRPAKIVVGPRDEPSTVAPLPVHPVDEDDTDELDASDIVEEAEELEAPEPEPEPEDEVVGVDEGVAEPPAPPQPPPPREGEGAETKAALAQLQAELDGTSAAAFEQKAREAAGREPESWYDAVFSEHFAALTRKSSGAVAKAEVEFWLTSSGLQPGARILDVGCGDGAHAIVMAQRGYQVVGLDTSVHQLRRAAKANEALGAGVVLVEGDMREPPVEGPFDGILCLGTTFGYFDDEDNRKVLKALAERLAPKGRMLLQVFNRDHVVARLPARSWWQGHGCLVLDEAEMNFFKNRLHVHRTVVFETGQQFTHDIHIRAYTAYELGHLCVGAGLRIVEISGSRFTRSRFYGATSSEIWLLVERA